MSKKFTTLDSNGFVNGFYDSVINKKIPENAIEITAAQYETLVTNQDSKAFVNGKIVSKKKPESFTASEAIKNIREKKITAGITVSGIDIKTDDKTQSRIIAARIKAKEDSEYKLNWKTSNGFVELTAPIIISISDAIHDHVQACFNAESLLDLTKFSDRGGLQSAFDAKYSEINS